MKVICLVRELMDGLGLDKDDVALGKLTQVDWRTIRKLRIDDENWRLSRKALHSLTLFAHSKGYRGIFEVRPLPFWERFKGSEAIIYREDRYWDAKGEAQLRDYLAKLNAEATVVLPDEEDLARDKDWHIERIADRICNRNCIFLGSPKFSFASEIALSLLWGAQPFDDSISNTSKIPLRFMGMSASHQYANSALIEGGSRYGIRIQTPETGQPVRIPVERFTEEEYEKLAGEYRDAGVVVVADQPLGTQQHVTTMIICGYTGLATSLATNELIYGDPPLELLEDRNLRIAAFGYKYRKLPKREDGVVKGLREPLENTLSWKWEEVVSTADAVALESKRLPKPPRERGPDFRSIDPQ